MKVQFINPEDDTQFYPGELAEGLAKDLLTYDKKLLNKNHVRVILTFYDIDEEQVQGYMELILLTMIRKLIRLHSLVNLSQMIMLPWIIYSGLLINAHIVVMKS